MGKRDRQDVDMLQNVWDGMEQLMNPMQNMERLMAEFTDVALRADEAGDIEFLQYLMQEMLPDLDVLSERYQRFLLGEDGEAFARMRKTLQERRRKLDSFDANAVVHVSSGRFSNTGDYVLVESLRHLIEESSSEIKWISTPVTAKVDDEFVKEANRSRGVIIGGGGLFLKDTNPNAISGWTWPCPVESLEKIKVPIYVMAVGDNRFRGQEEFDPCFTESVNTLVEKSSFFGLRNHGSIEAVRGYLREDLRDKVTYQPCATTVLSKMYQLPLRDAKKPFIALNCAYDRSELRYQGKQDEVMFAIARVLKKLSERYRIKCYIHCKPDEIACQYLDALEVPYEKTYLVEQMPKEEYLRAFTEPELVLAIRGHAQMIPFGCGTPVVSMISHDKLKWFLEDIGHPEWGVEVLDEQFEEKLLEKSLYMLEHREKICAQIAKAQDELWEITQQNLKKIML